MRPDEQGVRLLFVEHSPEYATLVCETLDASTRGHFDVRHAPRLDAAVDDLRRGDYDALLLDFTARDGAAVEKSIESASRLASRLPVILLTGSDDPQESTAPRVEDVRERMARSRLPSAILRAVRRHRRLGQQSASEPIVLRDPLRALAAAFARLRRT